MMSCEQMQGARAALHVPAKEGSDTAHQHSSCTQACALALMHHASHVCCLNHASLVWCFNHDCNMSLLAEVGYSSRNVLTDPDIREGVKTFSEWPTIPQVYIDGEFVGGSDILMGMHESGELRKMFPSET